MRSVTLPAAIIERFRSLSLQRLDRLEAGWTALVQGDSAPPQPAEVRRELSTLKSDARAVGFNDLQLICHKLEQLLSVAEARRYEVPDELDLFMTMAIRLMSMLLRTKDGVSLGGIDVDGFVQELDDLLADNPVRSIATTTEPGPTSLRTATPESLDRVSEATQRRLAVAATAVFLEHLRSPEPARARMLAAWSALSREISSLHAVPLGARPARHQRAALSRARELGKDVTIELITGDVRVRADVAEALDAAIAQLLRNAVEHGVEIPEERGRAGKPAAGRICVRVRLADASGASRGAAVAVSGASRGAAEAVSGAELVVEDDGRGIDLEVTDKGLGLHAVRAAVARVGGCLTLTGRAGQGTAAVVRIPQASHRIKVFCFKARDADLVLAVPATFRITTRGEGAPSPIDPLDALDLRAASPAHGAPLAGMEARVLVLEGRSRVIAIKAGGAPHPRTAERFCPTGDDHLVEVVRVGDMEALLIRPELLSPTEADPRAGS